MTAILIRLALAHWKPLAIVAVAAAAFGLWQMDRARQFEAGRTAERAAAVERAAELIKSRAKDDKALERLDEAGLCIELGGSYVEGECI